MQNAYGTSLYVLAFLLFVSLIGTNWQGYAHTFSDWSNPEDCDYVTNLHVYRWYAGKDAKWFRTGRIKGKLPDTYTLGIDYYALYAFFPLDSLAKNGVLPEALKQITQGELARGRVYYFRVDSGRMELIR